jgi:hypothetical protein
VVILLQHVEEGRQYYYQHISLTGVHGEVFLVRALETRTVRNVTVLVRLENGDQVRVKMDHLHVTAPKSPAERRKIREAKNAARLAKMRQKPFEESSRIWAEMERERKKPKSIHSEKN